MEKCLKLLPAVKNSGFSMEGYYVWCGSVIKENGKYYLFAARWPKETGFPLGYMTHSEIVLATTDDLNKPFKFEKVIIGRRDGQMWDSGMAHNPFIFKIKDTYMLYYIGTINGDVEKRAIGYAYSKNIEDGWVRSEKAFELPKNANNPAMVEDENGDILLYFRDGSLKVSVAKAKSVEGPFEVLNDNLFTKGIIEDMFVYKEDDGTYTMIAEDAAGKYTGVVKAGVKFKSKDGIVWDNDTAELAYDFNVSYDDGSELVLQRRERPFILNDGDERYLFTTAKIGGETMLTGGDTWNMVQKIEE